MRYHNVSFMSQFYLHFLFIQSLYSISNLLNFFIYYSNRERVNALSLLGGARSSDNDLALSVSFSLSLIIYIPPAFAFVYSN